MPTGYTHNVCDGKLTDFSEFAMQCARAFGALVMMRDDPMDAKIPDEFEPSSYNQKALAEAKERMCKLEAMSPAEVADACVSDYETRMASREKYKVEQRLENERLEAMAAHVVAWEPPSENHTEMKSFMLDQLHISKHDLASIDKYDPIEKLEPKEWFRKQIEKAHRDIGYNAGEHAKEIERARGRTLWVKQLRGSLAVTSANLNPDREAP